MPLEARIDAAHARVRSGASTLAQEVAAIPEADRLGLGAGSLQSYIRNPLLWGENRAAWERQAVRTLPHDLGSTEACLVLDEAAVRSSPSAGKPREARHRAVGHHPADRAAPPVHLLTGPTGCSPPRHDRGPAQATVGGDRSTAA